MGSWYTAATAPAIRTELRQEVYADDSATNPTLAPHPYTVSEQRFTVRRLQPAQGEGPAVFRQQPAETLSWTYDRVPTDPRVSHQLVLATDDYGNVLQAAALSYPRRSTSSPKTAQQALAVVLTEADFINQDGELDYPSDGGSALDVWHIGLGYRTKTWQLTGTTAYTDAAPATQASLAAEIAAAQGRDLLAFEETPAGGSTEELRLIGHRVTRFHSDTVGTPESSLGVVGLRALPYEQYLLALTGGLHAQVFPSSGTFADRISLGDLRTVGGYVELASDGEVWVPSGVLTRNSSGFFEPTVFTDPFGNETTFTWDADALAVTEVEDAVENTTTATLDYRFLAPTAVVDANGTTAAVALDPLGRVTAFIVYYSTTDGDDDLADPTTKFTYADTQWSGASRPNSVTIEARKTHGGSWPTAAADRQTQVVYSDGSGRVVQTKVQAEAGLVPERDGSGDLVFSGGVLQWTAASTRWIGTGRTVVDNKGNVVKQYEPFFSDTEAFEDEVELVEWGVTPVMFYDPVGRNVRTQLPDGAERTWSFSPWRVEARDENDTYAGSDTSHPAYDHKNTPTVTHLDAQGRVFRTDAYLVDASTVSDEDTDTDVLRTAVALDVQGNPLTVTDPRGNAIQVQIFDLLGRPLFTGAADEGYGTTSGAGETRILPDIAGQVVQTWRSHTSSDELVLVRTFDALRRPLTLRYTDDVDSDVLVEVHIYGDFDGGVGTKAKGRLFRLYDTAGQLEISEYDFKGNVVAMRKTLPADLTADVDWDGIETATTLTNLDSAVAGTSILATGAANSHELTRTFDALNRLLTETGPDDDQGSGTDRSVTTYGYDTGGRLKTVQVAVRGAAATTFVSDITYNARGQRLTIVKGDDGTATKFATTTYTYDEKPGAVRSSAPRQPHAPPPRPRGRAANRRLNNAAGTRRRPMGKGVTPTLTLHPFPVNDALKPLPAASRRGRPGLGGAGPRSRRTRPTAAGCAG